MQEEVTQKTIALVIKTAKLDANVLKAAMRMYLNHRRQKAQKTHGKISVKKLVGEGVGVSSIEVTDGNIKSFERVARKYKVDFAVKKDKTRSIEDIKSFISRQSDIYKVPYETQSKDRPRQCVFGGTSNAMDTLPLDRTGNRRFMPVMVYPERADCHILDNEALSREYIEQGKGSNYEINIYCCISYDLDNVLIVKNSSDMKCVGKKPYTSLLLTRIRLGLI